MSSDVFENTKDWNSRLKETLIKIDEKKITVNCTNSTKKFNLDAKISHFFSEILLSIYDCWQNLSC